MKRSMLVIAISLALGVYPALGHNLQRRLEPPARTHAHSAPFYRTELFFGLSIPGGGRVSEEEWLDFMGVITSRFPDGFTIIDATGQYKQVDGQVIREPSKVIVILYPARTRVASRRKIEEIRRSYMRRFKQESVLRMDYPNVVDVTF